MRIIIKSTKLDLTPPLRVYIDRKLGVLGRYIKRFERGGEAELRLEVARTTRHHHRGEVFMAEGNLVISGKVLRARHDDEDVRAAIDKLQIQFKTEIEKYRTKELDGPKRLGRKNSRRAS